MFEGSAHIEFEKQPSGVSRETVQGLGRASYLGVSLSGDRIISTEPYVDGEGDSRDYYVDVIGPNPAGQLETARLALEDALRQTRRYN